MENYNNEDAFVDMLNRNKKIEEEKIITQNEIANNAKVYLEQIRCANARQKWVEEGKKRIERKNVIRRWVVAGTIVGTLLTGLTVNAFFGDDITAYNQRQKEISLTLEEQSSAARMELIKKNLAYIDERKAYPFQVLDNTAYDYSFLNISEAVDVYVYKMVLPKDEFVKFITSVSYSDENGNHYYSDFEDFLNVNGYANENEFEKDVKDKLFEENKSSYKGGK